jgi:hypothetical protein
MMFLVSDFRELGADADRHIRQLASHGDVFLLFIHDPVEAELPPPGRYRIQMGEQSFAIDTADEGVRARHRERFLERRARIEALGRLPGVTLIDCVTSEDPYAVLSRRFARR